MPTPASPRPARTTLASVLVAIVMAMVAVAGLAGCGDDESASTRSAQKDAAEKEAAEKTTTTATPDTTTPDTTTPDTTTTSPGGTASTTASPSTTGEPDPATTTSRPSTTGASTTVPGATSTPGALAQPAIWPASDVVFTSPEQAAEDFMTTVFGFAPALGEFQGGDSRSGEIEVFVPDEGAGGGTGSKTVRSTLLLRKLGPSDGWFVLAAVSPHTTITSPESGAGVPASAVTVKGVGRGFEGLIVVEAFKVGSGTKLDQKTAMGGSMGNSEPYQVTLGLTGVTAGDRVLVLARGGVGLETDPGEFSAIPITISGAPATTG